MTAAERLVALAGSTGTAAALLLLLASGATAGEALTAYSGLDGETAAVHLMTDVAAPEEEEEPARYWGPPVKPYIDQRPRRRREEVAGMLCGIL
jgi:hypothetical protein